MWVEPKIKGGLVINSNATEIVRFHINKDSCDSTWPFNTRTNNKKIEKKNRTHPFAKFIRRAR